MAETHRQTKKQTDIATLWLIWPRGPSQWKLHFTHLNTLPLLYSVWISELESVLGSWAGDVLPISSTRMLLVSLWSWHSRLYISPLGHQQKTLIPVSTSLSLSIPPYLQNIITPKPWELERWNFERMFNPTKCHLSGVRCHVSGVTYQVSCVRCHV